MTKYINRLIIVLIISISLFINGTIAYDDVPNDSQYFYAVEYLRRNDVFADKKLFKPDTVISKAEFIKYLVILNSADFKASAKVRLPFSDTTDTSWYAPYFNEAIKLGILDGGAIKAQPYKKSAIVDALELLFHSKSIPLPRKHVGPIPYTDVAKNKNVQALIMRAISLGIVQPEKGDYFGLYRKVTRAKAAHMIYKMDLVDLRDPSQTQSVETFDIGLQKIINTWNILKTNFVDRDKIDQDKLSGSAIKAMVETLDDPYTVFMDSKENQAFSDDIEGQFEGIGAYIALDESKQITIVAPTKDSPAYKAGIKFGDIIKKIDEFNMEGATLYDAVSKIKGAKGTKVKLTLMRDGSSVVLEVVRDVINVASVEYETVDNGKIMHIKLINFSQNGVKDFSDVADIISADTKIKGIILDMRDNPGGLLDVAIGILNFFLPKDSVAVQIKYNYYNLSQNTTGDGALGKYPLIVLVNKGSASASEIVAGALKEHDVAKIMGETTFGKGTVQEVNYFDDNSSLKLTVAEWLTPNLNSVEGQGIKPDIEVKKAVYETTDNQLIRAIQELNKSF